VIESTYPFTSAVQAERRQQDGHVHGKIVLDLAA
jgi:NADPH:quinone reductase-like Zn-dependent oxidoreductase